MPWSIDSEHFTRERVDLANAEAARMSEVFIELASQDQEPGTVVSRKPTFQSLGSVVSITTVSPEEFASLFPAHDVTEHLKTFN